MRTLRSTATELGDLELRIVEVERPQPNDDEVLVRVEAAPINPSDLRVLLAGADLSTASLSGSAALPVLSARLPEGTLGALAARVGMPMPVGNEGAGVVVEAGSSPQAQALLGRTIGVRFSGMYSEFACVPAARCIPLADGIDPRAGASMFVNPLTALGMTETMRREGHSALVHTAAASNLGQMLVKLCLADGIPLVNVVRRRAQAELLSSLGAKYVVNSELHSFEDDLHDAILDSGATIGFDATGGGDLTSKILTAMESAANESQDEGDNPYGSTVSKQMYIYGGLDRSQTVLNRTFGMKWSVGGWLLPHHLEAIGAEAAHAMGERVAREIETTFASSYLGELSLAEVLDPVNVAAYARQATGEKFLITPQA